MTTYFSSQQQQHPPVGDSPAPPEHDKEPRPPLPEGAKESEEAKDSATAEVTDWAAEMEKKIELERKMTSSATVTREEEEVMDTDNAEDDNVVDARNNDKVSVVIVTHPNTNPPPKPNVPGAVVGTESPGLHGFRIPKKPTTLERMLITGTDDAQKAKRNEQQLLLQRTIWPSKDSWQEYRKLTGTKSTQRNELFLLDKHGCLAPLWRQYNIDKDPRKLLLGVVAARVAGKREFEVRKVKKGGKGEQHPAPTAANSSSNTKSIQVARKTHLKNPLSVKESSYATQTKKGVKTPKAGDPTYNPHFLQVYVHNEKNTQQYSALSEEMWNKLGAQILTKMYAPGKTAYPICPLGWASTTTRVPSHGWVKPNSEADKKNMQEMISSIVIDDVHFKAWSIGEVVPQYAPIQICSQGKADMYAALPLNVLIDALHAVNFSKFNADDILFTDAKKITIKDVSNFAINLRVKNNVWDHIIAAKGVVRVFTEEWKVYYHTTHLNKNLAFPPNTARNAPTDSNQQKKDDPPPLMLGQAHRSSSKSNKSCRSSSSNTSRSNKGQ